MEQISLKFDGGLAAKGQLHYYDYTRSQYATARFVSHLEHFRRTGEVANKITQGLNIEIIVETPREGSFLEILLVKTQEAAAVAISAPLSSLISLLWTTILPRREKTESDVVELARIRLAEKNVDLELEGERAKRDENYRKIVETQSATNQQALELVRDAMQSSNTAQARAGLTQSRLQQMGRELLREQSRQGRIDSSRSVLQNIDSERLNQLAGRVRPIIPDMALPLRRSAEILEVGSGPSREPIFQLNPANVNEITSKRLSDTPETFIVRVKAYDRDRGVGKVSSEDFPRPLNFVVPPVDQLRLLQPILLAMRTNTVLFLCRVYRDLSGFPTSLVLEDIL